VRLLRGAAGWEKSPPPASCASCQQRGLRTPQSLGVLTKKSKTDQVARLGRERSVLCQLHRLEKQSFYPQAWRRKGLIQERPADTFLACFPTSQHSVMTAMKLRKKARAFLLSTHHIFRARRLQAS